ncbi:MAG TPA: transcriptional regulator [Polyangiaceae bacterium]|nr:transcriptional regulator [Polyangiaceae bacterium]
MSHRGSKPPAPANVESTSTVRERIAQALRGGQLTAREISERASVQERDVAEHLKHLEYSLPHGGEELQTGPPHCIKCGFEFSQRERHSRPSRCPRCKSERISPPRFQIVPQSQG